MNNKDKDAGSSIKNVEDDRTGKSMYYEIPRLARNDHLGEGGI